jgi:hypothetical protein
MKKFIGLFLFLVSAMGYGQSLDNIWFTSKGNIIIRGDILLLPHNNNIQYKSIELTYIKKAKIVDLLLNHNSDLSSEVLEEIMSELAIFIKAITSDNNQEFKQENLIIE